MPMPEGGVSTVYIAEIDVKGKIPQSVIKFGADLQVKVVADLKKYLIKKEK